MDWTVVEDAGRGWRRVVASPIPKEIVELDSIRILVEAGVVAITVGGGGIPVIDPGDSMYQGTAAVIDKDFASSLLAQKLNADLFLISTAVEKVAINFGKPDQAWIDHMTISKARISLKARWRLRSRQSSGISRLAVKRRSSLIRKISAALYAAKPARASPRNNHLEI